MNDSESRALRDPSTSRLIRGNCSVCGQLITVNMYGVAPTVTDEEWFASLELWQRVYLHDRHIEDGTPIIGSRAVTKPVRAQPEDK